MNKSYLNKSCHIGPGGINCGCCIDYPKKRKNHKHCYSRRMRTVLKRISTKEIIKELFDERT